MPTPEQITRHHDEPPPDGMTALLTSSSEATISFTRSGLNAERRCSFEASTP